MPALPSSLLEPIWVEFAALLPDRSEFHPDHPLGCHRRRIPDRIVFEHLIDALVHGSGYERVATAACSDSTIRRRLKDWAGAGIAEKIHAIALAAYHRIIGLDLDHIGVDGCITKAPCGGEKAGPSPVDRRKGGLKRSVATDTTGVPLGVVSAAVRVRPHVSVGVRPHVSVGSGCWSVSHGAVGVGRMGLVSLSLSRQLGPLIEMTSQWWRNLSRMAVARTSSVNTWPHSLNDLLLVMMVDAFSYRRDTTWKTRLASTRSSAR